MVSGDTPTSPLVAFALLNPVTLSREHLAIALKATKSLTAFSRLSTLLAHLVQIWEESLSCFSTAMPSNREILGAHPFWIPAQIKRCTVLVPGTRDLHSLQGTLLEAIVNTAVSVCHVAFLI